MKKFYILIVLIGLLCFQPEALAKLTNAEFIKYCKIGSYENIERMIKEGADVNATPEDLLSYSTYSTTTPLWAAVINNPDDNVVKLLIRNGAFVNKHSNFGILETAVFYKRSFELIKFLVENGADININTASIFQNAMYHPNSAELIQYLISKGADVNEIGDTCGPALLEAVRYGSLETVKILINNGANIHYKDKWSNSILANALNRPIYKHDTVDKAPEIVDFLIKSGANMYDTNNKGETIVEQSAWYITPARLDVLLKNNYKFKEAQMEPLRAKELDVVLLTAAKFNKNPATIQKLIDLGADVNINPLFIYQLGQDLARFLGVPNNMEYVWETPLKNVACYLYEPESKENIDAKLEIIKILLKNGASITAMDSDEKPVSIIDLVEQEYAKAKEKQAMPRVVQYYSEVLKLLRQYNN